MVLRGVVKNEGTGIGIRLCPDAEPDALRAVRFRLRRANGLPARAFPS